MTKSTRVLLSEVIKRQLQSACLDQVTVKGIVGESGVNRKTFYYNYRDRYDLAKTALFDDLSALLDDNFLADSWKTGMTAVPRVYPREPRRLQQHHALILQSRVSP